MDARGEGLLPSVFETLGRLPEIQSGEMKRTRDPMSTGEA